MQREGVREGRERGPSLCLCFSATMPLWFLIAPMVTIVTFPLWAALLLLIIRPISRQLDQRLFELDNVTTEPAGVPRARIGPARPVSPIRPTEPVQILSGGEFVANRLKFRVKVLNKTKYVITDVTVSLATYPRDALSAEGPTVKVVAKVSPSGFANPTFDFMPTKDCIKGSIVASVSYLDDTGNAHVAMTDPFTVRAVCDLLMPEIITSEQFELKLLNLNHEEMTFKVVDWTPEQMRSKTIQVLEKSNFSEVTSNHRTIGEQIESRISGWARGKYTGKNLAVEVTVTGRPGSKGATCRVRMSGQDQAMILPAIDEMSQKLSAWLCPMCAGEISASAVDDIRAGRQTKCPFCGVALSK